LYKDNTFLLSYNKLVKKIVNFFSEVSAAVAARRSLPGQQNAAVAARRTLPGYPGKLMTWMTWHKKTHIIVGFVLRTYNPYVVSFELV
jgi:hypothetical protein